MLEVTKDPNRRVEEMNVADYTKRVKKVYVKVEEYLIDFLNRCKMKNSEVILCPRCSAVFDKKVTKDIKEFNLQQPKKRPWVDRRSKFTFEEPQMGTPYQKYQTPTPLE